MTWHKARSISSGLTPQLLVSSGLDRPERAEPRGAAASGPSPGPPPSSPSPTGGHQPPHPPMPHTPAGVEQEEERLGQQAASAVRAAQSGANESSSQHADHSQPPAGANQEGSNHFPATHSDGRFPEGASASFSHTDRQPKSGSSAADQPGSSADQSQLSQPAASDRLPGPQEAQIPSTANPSEALGQSRNPQDPSQTPSGAPQLGRLSPPSNMELHNTMSSEPSSHKLSALEERYATGVPVTADEAFNRALQQRHSRQGSWGSDTSVSSMTNPPAALSTAAGPAAASAGVGVSDNISSSSLLATIHSGIPSTDDDGPIFTELGKLVAEEEAEAAGQGRGQLTAGGSEGQDRDVDLNQVSWGTEQPQVQMM